MLTSFEVKTLKKGIIFLSLLFFIHHLSLWILTFYTKNYYLVDALENYDSAHYNKIINFGYDSRSIAFFPFYPFLIKGISLILPIPIALQFIGTIFSTFLFIIFLCLVFHLVGKNEQKYFDLPLYPTTILGFYFFIYSPSSFVFHTHHTESLFLLLTLLSLIIYKKNWAIASLLAGFCALTKNQGVVFAFCLAILITTEYKNYKEKIIKFIISGLISFSCFSIFLIFQYYKFDNFLAFMEAQKNWHFITSINEYVLGFFSLLKYKYLSRFEFIETLYFLFLFIFSFTLLKKEKPIFLYCFISLLMLPLQGTLINTYRYTCFLFPLLFVIGDYFSKKNKILIFVLVVFLFYLNHQMTRNYIMARWSY